VFSVPPVSPPSPACLSPTHCSCVGLHTLLSTWNTFIVLLLLNLLLIFKNSSSQQFLK
jgi:hypothetical protein